MAPPDVDAKLAELREVIREANAAIKDARAAKRELAEAITEFQRDAHEWRLAIQKVYVDEMNTALNHGLGGLMAFVNTAEERLTKRLDNIMMAITKPYQTPEGPLTLEEILRRKAQREGSFPYGPAIGGG